MAGLASFTPVSGISLSENWFLLGWMRLMFWPVLVYMKIVEVGKKRIANS